MIVEFLIDWSREKTRQAIIDEERRETLAQLTKQSEESRFEEETKSARIRSNIERKHHQKAAFIFAYDQQLFTSYQWNFHLEPRTDDEREPTMNSFDQGHEEMSRLVIDRFHIPVYIHPHETSTSMLNDEHEVLPSSVSSCGYFRDLREKFRRCRDDANDQSQN